MNTGLDVASRPSRFRLRVQTLRKSIAGSLGVVFRNRLAALGFLIVLLVSVTAAFAPLLTTHDAFQMDLTNRLTGPSLTHVLGTDIYGRDIFTRIVLGSRIAMQVALGAVLLAGIKRVMRRAVVDLPQPLSPTRPTVFPSGIPKLT